jgi:hypothetical protein
MSDGPFKSLPMKPRWKAAAKCAFNEAYSRAEIADALRAAAHSDWRGEISDSFLSTVARVLGASDQLGLFRDQQLSELRAMQGQYASTMQASLLRNAVDAVRDGYSGAEAMRQATESTLSDRLLSGFRQVEEHICRENSGPIVREVRSRLEAAHGEVDFSSLARAVLKTGVPVPRSAAAKYANLDDGVSL